MTRLRNDPRGKEESDRRLPKVGISKTKVGVAVRGLSTFHLSWLSLRSSEVVPRLVGHSDPSCPRKAFLASGYWRSSECLQREFAETPDYANTFW